MKYQCIWGANDPSALHIHKQNGEIITVDNQSFSVVEDVGFKHLLHSMEPRYKIPSRKYFSETVISNIFSCVHDGINTKLCKISSFSFTADLQTTNGSSDLLLSFTAHCLIFKSCSSFKCKTA